MFENTADWGSHSLPFFTSRFRDNCSKLLTFQNILGPPIFCWASPLSPHWSSTLPLNPLGAVPPYPCRSSFGGASCQPLRFDRLDQAHYPPWHGFKAWRRPYAIDCIAIGYIFCRYLREFLVNLTSNWNRLLQFNEVFLISLIKWIEIRIVNKWLYSNFQG